MRTINLVPESVRFILAGGFAALASWLVRFPLSLYMPFPVAVAVATSIGMCISFGAYRCFVFPGSERPLSRQVRDFIIVNLAGIGVVTAVATLFANFVLPEMELITQFEGLARSIGVATGAVTEGLAHAIGVAAGAVSNFWGHRSISFRRPTSETPRVNSSYSK